MEDPYCEAHPDREDLAVRRLVEPDREVGSDDANTNVPIWAVQVSSPIPAASTRWMN